MLASQLQPAGAAIERKSPILATASLRLAVLLFLFLNCAYLVTSSGRARTMDEIDPVLQSENLLLRHSAAIPQAPNSDIYFGKVDRHGVPRSAWPVGQAFAALPWSALGHYWFARLPGIPRSISDLAYGAAVCWSNATFTALAVAAAFLLFVGLGLAPRSALAASLLMAFCTPLWVYSSWLYSEPVTLLCLIAAAMLWFGGDESSNARTVMAALLVAYSLHVRPANVVLAAVFVVAAALMEHSEERQGFRYRRTALLAAVLFVFGALYLWRNYAYFGNALDFGVPTRAEGGKELDSWHGPFHVGLFGFLFSPGKSIFLFCPPILLGIAGLPRLWRINRGLAACCGGSALVNLIFYSFRTQFEGGWGYGPRHMTPSMILLSLPAAALFRDPPGWFKPALWFCAITGFLVQALGLATNFIEDMVANHYYVGNWNYRMGYSPITGQLRLIWKYLHQPAAGLGLGWDRWFVFLHAAGANWTPLLLLLAVFLVGTLGFGVMLWRASQNIAS
jgi:hypothetical protein